MSSQNNFPLTTFKATLLATTLFWTLITIEENLNFDMIPIIFISTIPIFIICFLAILFTIMPIYWLNKETSNNDKIFKTYFPFYAIIMFAICSYFIVLSDFDTYTIGFLVTVFFTAMQTWIWLFKTTTK